jgi:hypothetical protein
MFCRSPDVDLGHMDHRCRQIGASWMTHGSFAPCPQGRKSSISTIGEPKKARSEWVLTAFIPCDVPQSVNSICAEEHAGRFHQCEQITKAGMYGACILLSIMINCKWCIYSEGTQKSRCPLEESPKMRVRNEAERTTEETQTKPIRFSNAFPGLTIVMVLSCAQNAHRRRYGPASHHPRPLPF